MSGDKGGRPRTPTALRALQGGKSSDPNPAEPTPAEGDVKPPFTLTKAAADVWVRLAPDLIAKGVLTPWDVDLFAEFCEAVPILRAKRRASRRKPRPGESSPMAEYRAAMQIVTTLGGRFGLTPSDRARIVAAPAEGGGRGDQSSGLLTGDG